MKRKVSVIVPTIDGREFFDKQIIKVIKRQTVQPDEIYHIKSDLGITSNYKRGLEQADNGLAICMENDDWYHETYIQTMLEMWEKLNHPDLLGLNYTIYFHIKSKRYILQNHPNRASMMSTLINIDSMKDKIVWPGGKTPYLDLHLWGMKKIRKEAFATGKVLALGMKHGIGLTGGGGHISTWPGYDMFDGDDFLAKHMDKKSIAFYNSLIDKYEML